MTILQPKAQHLDDLARLFNDYRMFYRQEHDMELAREFINERIAKRDSLFLIATDSDGMAKGFLQVYPTYSSIQVGQVWLINDLYVDRACRGLGLAKALLQRTLELAQTANVKAVRISTEFENSIARSLYEAHGFKHDNRFIHFTLPITPAQVRMHEEVADATA